jgi:O-antigen/teichoic acid export membrane protein
MLPDFTSPARIKKTLEAIKRKSLRLMHFLYPITILLMVFANKIFPTIFNPSFIRSADVFMVYVLLITSRLLFPQTILIGLKKTRVVMVASIMNMILNIGLTIMFLRVPRYGIVGVAVATVIVFFIEKAILIAYNYFKLKINPIDYIPWKAYVIYSSIIVILFVLIDHRIIMIPHNY